MLVVTLQTLADLVDGKINGDPLVQISAALPQRDAVAGCITLADSPQQAVKANDTSAAAVVVGQFESACHKPMLVVKNIHEAFTKIVTLFRPIQTIRAQDNKTRIAQSAVIDSTAQVGAGSQIGERVVIGADCRIGQRCLIHPGVTLMTNCFVGDDCEIYPGCVLYPQTRLGNRVLLHANAVLGAFGFGYRTINGRHERTAQLGWVELCDDVEIGAGTTIDRGTYGATRIGQGTKIDNQVQIGHNCHIGEHNLFCSQVGIAGSSTTGNYVVMGGQVGVADHLFVPDGAMIGAQSGLMSNLEPGDIVVGSPAGPRRQKMIEHAIMAKLPDMRKELRGAISRIQELEQLISSGKGPAQPVDANAVNRTGVQRDAA